jgi:tRNA C32,U32 (ribose-2'-O)-methylase TrmJ
MSYDMTTFLIPKRNNLDNLRVVLLNEELSHCNWLMRIPTREEHGSMNLGQAVAVSLYEIIRDAKASSAKSQPAAKKIKKENTAATSGSIERMTHDLFEILDASGYVKPDADAPTKENLRRMIRRMEINSNDADMWLGMLRQIAWKLGTKNRGK